MHYFKITTPLRTAVLVAITLVVVTSCGADAGEVETSSPPPTPTLTDTSTTASVSSSSSDAVTSMPPGQGLDSRALERAAGTAVGAVPGSTVVSIETERDGTWEVQVVTADGVEHEMDVSGDGADVVAGPVSDNEDEVDRAKHRARVQAARLDYAAAVDAILAAVPNGTITELNLDGENGVTVWEADVLDDSGVKREVTIDAATGQVLRK
ncbi:PepSY domain-containing protein [Rhodococcus erythropolis]